MNYELDWKETLDPYMAVSITDKNGNIVGKRSGLLINDTYFNRYVENNPNIDINTPEKIIELIDNLNQSCVNY